MSMSRDVTSPTQVLSTVEVGYVIPHPATPRQRAAFVAQHEDRGHRVYHATGSPGGWEVDHEDWWLFETGWMTVGSAQVTRTRRLVNPNPRHLHAPS